MILRIIQALGLNTQPVAWEKSVKAIVYLLVGFSVVHWDNTQIVLVLAAFEGVSGLIVWNSVTPNTSVAQQVDDAKTAGSNEAVAQIAALAPMVEAAAPEEQDEPAPRRRRPLVAE